MNKRQKKLLKKLCKELDIVGWQDAWIKVFDEDYGSDEMTDVDAAVLIGNLNVMKRGAKTQENV